MHELLEPNALPAVFRFIDLSGGDPKWDPGAHCPPKKLRHSRFRGAGANDGHRRRYPARPHDPKRPALRLTDPYYIWMACLGAAIAWFFKFEGKWSRFLVVADAIVLGIWSATGAT